ncbi:plasmodesmata-located protein 5 [Triticum aestivum]|uniref:plasmodesmata-located protein 5 n=1 Tax=Triticum aestivum TaxID=4565 RepID=UPI0008425B86|nr:plasmodesmata-located protein 5-like [Triticum aestivum]
MALSRRLLLFLSLVAITAGTGTSEMIVTRCYPPPTPTVNGSTSAFFRRDLLSLLDALPSAAAWTGFASLRTGGSFARGLCFGDPAPDSCFRCLSDVGRKITDLCDDASRRAGFLNDGCFVGYADTNASSAGADDNNISGVSFSGDVIPRIDAGDALKLTAVARSLVPRSVNGQVAAADATATASNGDTVRVLAQCATDRAPAECARCLRDSSLQMAKSWGLTRSASTVQAVLGSNCYLRFEISAPPVGEKIRRIVKGHIVLTVCIGFIVAVAVAVLVVVRRKAGNTEAPAAEGKP